MSDAIGAVSYLPLQVSEDGRTVTARFLDAEGRMQAVTLPSPLSANLIADLQTADAIARDRYLGRPPASGGAVRVTAREPATAGAVRVPIDGSILLMFDRGRPTELSFRLPEGDALQLTLQILRASNQVLDEGSAD